MLRVAKEAFGRWTEEKKKSVENLIAVNSSYSTSQRANRHFFSFFFLKMWFIHFAVAVTRQGKVYRVLVPSVSNLICIFNHCVVVIIVSCASFVLIEASRAIVLLIFLIFFFFSLWLISKLRLPVH